MPVVDEQDEELVEVVEVDKEDNVVEVVDVDEDEEASNQPDKDNEEDNGPPLPVLYDGWYYIIDDNFPEDGPDW